jgi:hypothetical protein
MLQSFRRRTSVLVGAVAVAASVSLATSATATAVTPNVAPKLGTLTAPQKAGGLTTQFLLDTSGACPSTATNYYVTVTGPGWGTLPGGHGILVGNSEIAGAPGGGTPVIHTGTANTLFQIAKDNNVAWVAGGVYTLTLVCQANDATFSDVGEFIGAIHFTDATHWANGAIAPVIKVKTMPALSGTFKVGKKVTVTAGSWSVSRLTFHYQWTRDGKSIKGATKAAYTLVKADKGHKVGIVVTVSTTGYRALKVTVKAKTVA